MTENYLVVSLGSIGRRHLRNLRRLRPHALIGVLHLSNTPTDPMPDRVDFHFTSVNESLAFGPMAAIICSPAPTHLAVALALVEAGVPILIEKPIAHVSDGVPELLQLAVKRGVAVMIGYNLRFLPSLIETRRLIGGGVIGDVIGVRAEVGQFLPDWRPGKRYEESVSASQALGGGALLELSHEIDYLYWMFGAPMRVLASGGRYSVLEIDVEDMVSLLLEYERPRRLVNIHLDFLQRTPTRTCKFIGSKGTLIWNGIVNCIEIYRSEVGQWSQIEMPESHDNNKTYLDELSYFLQVIDQRSVPCIDGEHGLAVLRIVEAARESIVRRETVELS